MIMQTVVLSRLSIDTETHGYAGCGQGTFEVTERTYFRTNNYTGCGQIIMQVVVEGIPLEGTETHNYAGCGKW